MEDQAAPIGTDGLIPARDLPAPATGRTRISQELQRALDAIARRQGRAAVMVVEFNANYAERARERVDAVLALWQRERAEALYAAHLDCNRFALVLGPFDLPGQARSMAERFTRSLDPRICPLLRRALPYAWAGVSFAPDEGVDAHALVQRAEQALERARSASAAIRRGNITAFSRRRVATGALRPLAAG